MSENGKSSGTINLGFVEGLYADYLRNPAAVSDEWRKYFKEVTDGHGGMKAREGFGPTFQPPNLFNPAGGGRTVIRGAEPAGTAELQDRVNQLIRNYRVRGHIIARTDPLGLPRPTPPELDPGFLGFTAADMDRPITNEAFQYDGPLTVRELIQRLQNTYCQSIGVQYMHIDDLAIRRWLQKRMEGTENRLTLVREEQIRILTRLTNAVTFEEFLRKKFIGAKTFSLTGSESLIPLLDLAVEKAGSQGIREIVMGMAHRGRLNVLANILGKSPREIFREFADMDPELYVGRGDVKYHLGYSSDWKAANGQDVHLSLCFNPSHLEFVNPVVLGRTRAKQDRAGDRERTRCLALLIHGDAALAGEGIIQETLNLSQLRGYRVGGALHVVVNNQIGFTTGPEEGRSTGYATDVAKMLQGPIFHVNGEDTEAVAQVVQLAMDFRMEFKRDVFIDMYGYRRYGHNESDEPSFTQPALYHAIAQRKSVREGYLEHLLKLGGVTREEAVRIAEEQHAQLEKELSAARSGVNRTPGDGLRGIWSAYKGGPEPEDGDTRTGVKKETLRALLEKQTELPADFHPHPKSTKWLEARRAMAHGREPVDWSAAEALAFASIAAEGHTVRLSGQDSGRGTFSQRHAILYDHEDGHPWIPLQHLSPQQGPVQILNSPLSEAGVLGFDYGYSLDCPDGLVMWEAQYGDFVNAAQVIIDQFITSAEDKWRRLSGLVLLLPHGFEGNGPEHSSARLERFLALAAEDNIQVVCPTTAAQYFHVLRRQVARPWRKPLVVMTPKSLLRDRRIVSNLDEFTNGTFKRIISDPLEPAETHRVLLCTGKIYHDLDRERHESKRLDVAIVRLEQLYPLRSDEVESALARYRDGTPVFWVQEEPENMGAWSYVNMQFGEMVRRKFPFEGIFRPPSASPATGSHHSHEHEQRELLAEALWK